jgi:hypothetical protein
MWQALNSNGVRGVGAASDRLLNQTLQSWFSERLDGAIGFAVECGKTSVE